MAPKFGRIAALLAEAWDAKSGKAAVEGMSVARDAIEESGAKQFGLNSIEVKKDLYQKATDAATQGVRHLEGDQSNMDRSMWAAHSNSMQLEDNAVNRTGDPSANWNRPEFSEEPDQSFKRSWHFEPTASESERYTKNSQIRAVSGPAKYSQNKSGNGDPSKYVWKNLMDDPAYPAIATALAGAAGLTAGSAEAAQYKGEASPQNSKKLNLRPAQAPVDPWAGATAGVLQAENDRKRVEHAAATMGTAPLGGDVFPEGYYQEALKKHLEAQDPGVLSRMAQATGLPQVFEGLSAVEKNVVDPHIIKPLQENVGRPVLDASMKAGRKIFGKSAGNEYMMRSAGQLVAGKGQFEDYAGSSKGRSDIADMELGPLGPKGTAFATGIAQYTGEVPLMILGGDGTLFRAATDGALVALADPNISVGEGLIGAGVIHGGMTLLGKLAQQVARPLMKEIEPQADRIFGAAKAPVTPTAPPQLVGIITKDGLEAAKSSTLESPLTKIEEVTRLIATTPAGKPKPTPLMIVATRSVDGQPVLRKDFGTHVTEEPLTVKSADAAQELQAKGVQISLDHTKLDLYDPTTKDVVDAFFGINYSKGWYRRAPVEKKLKAADLEEAGSGNSDTWIVDRDYQGNAYDPVGAEVKLSAEGVPQITPVFDGETRLPDELPIPKEPTKSMRTPRDSQKTQPMGRLEESVIQDRPIFGGGSGTPPKNQRALPPGEDGKALRVQGEAMPEKPADVPPPMEGTVEQDHVDLLNEVMSKTNQINRDRGVVDKVRAFLVGRQLRGPIDEAALKASIQSTHLLQKTSDDIYRTARARFGGKLFDQADKDIGQFYLGKKSWSEVEAANPHLTAEARAFAESTFNEKEALDKYLQAKGFVPDDLAEARKNGMLDLYMARRYLAFAMPDGEWAKRLLAPNMADTLREGATFVVKEARKRNINVTADEVIDELSNIVRAKDPLKAFKDSAISRPFHSLLERKEVPLPIRKILGEVESGTINIAQTLGIQRAIVAKVDLMDEVAKSAKWSSPIRNSALDHIYQLPNHPSMYGARSRYVNQEVYEAIGNAPKMEAASHAIATEVLGFIKGNQVALGGVGPRINNVFGNLWSGVLAGGLDLTRPMKSGKAMKDSIRAIIDYHKDPTGGTGLGGLVLDAKRSGADHFGFSAEEIGSPSAKKFLRDLDAAFPSGENLSLFEGWGRLMKKSWGHYREFQSKAGSDLDMIDRVFRLQSYISLREKFIADLSKRGDKSYLVKAGLLSPASGGKAEVLNKAGQVVGFTPWQQAATNIRNAITRRNDLDPHARAVYEAASRLATYRVNQSFWNPTFIGSGLESLRRSGVGAFITPYATAAFESFRISNPYSIAKRLVNEPELGLRLAATGAIGAGVFGLMRQYGSVSEQDVRSAMAEVPEGRQTFKPAQWALPWRDEKGRVQLWDVTRQFDPLRYMAGNDADPMWRRVVANAVMSPIEDTQSGNAGRDLMVSSGFLRSTEFQKPVGEASNRGLAILQQLHRMGAFPGVAKGMTDAARRTGLGPLRPKDTEERLTPAQAVFKGLGGSSLEPVTSGARDPWNRANPSRLAGDIETRKQVGKYGVLNNTKRRVLRDQDLNQENKQSRIKEILQEKARINEERRSDRKDRKK